METDSAVKELIKDMDIKLIKSKHRCPQKAKCEEEKKPMPSTGPLSPLETTSDKSSLAIAMRVASESIKVDELAHRISNIYKDKIEGDAKSEDSKLQGRKEILKLAWELVEIDKQWAQWMGAVTTHKDKVTGSSLASTSPAVSMPHSSVPGSSFTNNPYFQGSNQTPVIVQYYGQGGFNMMPGSWNGGQNQQPFTHQQQQVTYPGAYPSNQ